MKEQSISIGEDLFIESSASENNFCVMFEDDTETGYFYGGEKDPGTGQLRILDMVHIYDVASIAEAERHASVCIIWSTDWLRCGLIINNYCHAVFDFANQGAYNRNEFPPPNSFWTKNERKLSDEMIAFFFNNLFISRKTCLNTHDANF